MRTSEPIFSGVNRVFVIVCNKAVTAPFNLSDMPGSAGRMDLVCRFIAQSIFISHGVRRDSAAIAILKGKPDPPKAILVKGSEVRYMAPDERNVGGIIRKALSIDLKSPEWKTAKWRRSTPGVYVAKKGLRDVLSELEQSGFDVYYLKEDGKDIRNVSFGKKLAFVLGDHIGLSREDESTVKDYAKDTISLSPLSLQADQCVVIVHYELDNSSKDSQCFD